MRLIYLLPSQDARPVAEASAGGSFQAVDGTGLGKAKEKWRIGGIGRIAYLGQRRDEYNGHLRAHYVAACKQKYTACSVLEDRLFVRAPTVALSLVNTTSLR